MPKALIVGAGIGGLAAAIALRDIGFEVVVVEQAPAIREIGAGISLWANAIRALDRLGVGAAVRDAGVAYESAAIRSRDGSILAAIDTNELRRRLGTPVVVMHRADLLGALLRRAAGIDLRFGRRCMRITQGDAYASAELEGGGIMKADVLIGADGLHSVVRSTLHGSVPPRSAGCTAWRSVVRYEGSADAGETWGHGSVFGRVPMSGRRVYWFATENLPPGEPRGADEKSRLLARFRGWHRPIESLIAAAEESEILRNDIFDRPPLSAWGSGRVTLVGDAAHPMLPFLGQGGCQALEDAVAIGDAFSGHADLRHAARAYETARLRRANLFVTRSRLMGRIAQLERPIAVWLRNAIVGRTTSAMQARQIARLIDARMG